MSKGWIGVDLDGTLAEYYDWQGIEHIGKPILLMLKRVRKWLLENRQVKIFTARVAHGPEAIKYIEEWLKAIGLPALEITNVKDFGMIELWDDRAVSIVTNKGCIKREYITTTRGGRMIKYWCKNGHTKSFTSLGRQRTLMGWQQEYDAQGRSLRADPNYTCELYVCNECHITYSKITKGWNIKFYEGKVGYYSDKKPDFEMDITPDYLKEDNE